MKGAFLLLCAIVVVISLTSSPAQGNVVNSDSQNVVDHSKPCGYCKWFRKCPPGQYCEILRCHYCSDNCVKCKDSKHCEECEPGWILKDNACVKKPVVCPDGKYWDGSCCKDCDKSCATCSGDATTCTSCTGPKVLKDGKCEDCGPRTYYDPSSNSCKDCGENCKECSDCDHCITCDPGFVEKNGKCVEKPKNCPAGKYWDGSKGYVLKDGKCDIKPKNCPAGQYWDGSCCKNCGDNCSKCTDADTCTKCSKGYVLKDGKCDIKPKNCPAGQYWDGSCCKNCGDNCSKCTDADTCTICNDGYVLNDDGKCIEKVHYCDAGCSNDGNHFDECCPSNSAFFANPTGVWGTCFSTCRTGAKKACMGRVWIGGNTFINVESTYQAKTDNWVIVCPEHTELAGHWSVIAKVNGAEVNACACPDNLSFTTEMQGYCCHH
eukprot:Nk52_evm7s277 gene=Nk52_evmTU7s277